MSSITSSVTANNDPKGHQIIELIALQPWKPVSEWVIAGGIGDSGWHIPCNTYSVPDEFKRLVVITYVFHYYITLGQKRKRFIFDKFTHFLIIYYAHHKILSSTISIKLFLH